MQHSGLLASLQNQRIVAVKHMTHVELEQEKRFLQPIVRHLKQIQFQFLVALLF